MKISALSLDLHLAILNQLPNQTLLGTVPLVCTRWNQLQPYVCRQRHAVKLKMPRNSWPKQSATSRHFLLYPAPLDTPYATALIATFPNVTHLVIDCLGFEALDQQLHLLQSWAPTLASLHLTQIAKQGQLSPPFSDFLVHLLALLNQMPHLKRLNLNIRARLPPSADLSGILRRLVDVDLNFFGSERILVPQLLQYCSPNLQRLSLGYIRHFRNFLPLLTSPFLCSKLAHLKVRLLDATQLAIIADHCSHLQAFYHYLFTLGNYADCLQPLTKLPNLTRLSLRLKQRIAPIEPVVPSSLPVLPSIRQLRIYLPSLLSHEHFVQSTQMDQVFPKLEQIELYWYARHVGCRQCIYNNRDSDSCIDALLRPLTRLEMLQVADVYLIENDKYCNWLPRLRSQ